MADVWTFVADLSKTPQWRTTVTSVVPPAELEPGAEFQATTRLLGRDWLWRLRINSLEPERVLSYDVVEGAADLHVDYRLEPEGHGCRFTLTGRSRPRSPLSRLIDKAGAWRLRREIDGQLLDLKRLLEAACP